MTNLAELTRLAHQLPTAELANHDLLVEAGRTLDVEWPAEYVALVSAHNGAEGVVGDWLLVLTRVEDLVEQNSPQVIEFFPGLVVIGGDGGGEALAIDRATQEILLVPWIGGQEDWLVLGKTLTEAMQRMERAEVFDAPHWKRP